MNAPVISDRQEIVDPTHLGGKGEIRGVQERLLKMIPGAADLPREVVLAAAQISVVYRLDPIMGELVIARMGSKKAANNSWQEVYVPIITLKGLRNLARRQSNYTVATRYMSAEEVETYRGNLYHDNDIGAEVTLWRLDLASECKRLGIEYHPSIGIGFWRQNAKGKRDNNGNVTHYTPDELPETWTRHHVAEKRAESNALKKAFDLRLPGKMFEEHYDIEAEAIEVLDTQDRITAIIDTPESVIVEEDGDVLYAAEPSRTKDPQSKRRKSHDPRNMGRQSVDGRTDGRDGDEFGDGRDDGNASQELSPE